MPRHTFIRQSKIRDVKGRIDYIQNPKRQEHLYGAYDTTKPEYWKLLAAQNQMDFQRSGTSGKCIEARELIIALPEGLQLYEPEKLLKMMTDAFKEKYGVECAAALHHNKRKTNYHIHLIYSERQILEKVEEKIAARNMFYDENGRHVRTKKEIMDAINKDIRFNIWEWQKGEKQNKYIANKGGIAEGIERLFYICPKCEEIGSLTTGGSEIKCRCGYKVSMLETGFLDPIDPFETIKDWSDWQDSELKKRIEHFKGTEDSTLLFQDENLTLTSIDNKHNEALVASGKLSLAMGDEGLILSVGGEEGKRFYLENIESMAMILYNRIVFSIDGMYYEIKPDNMKGRINLRKYLVVWQLIHNPRKDSGEV